MWKGTPEQQGLIRSAIENGDGLQHLGTIQQAMQQTGALDYTREKALQAAEQAVKALTPLQDSSFKQALVSLARLSVERVA